MKALLLIFVFLFAASQAPKKEDDTPVVQQKKNKKKIFDLSRLGQLQVAKLLEKKAQRFEKNFSSRIEIKKREFEERIQALQEKIKNGIDATEEQNQLQEEYLNFTQKMNKIRSNAQEVFMKAQHDFNMIVKSSVESYCKKKKIKKLKALSSYVYLDSDEVEDLTKEILEYIDSQKSSINIILPEIDI